MMTILLKPEIEKYVAERVRAGEYGSAEEAVNALLSSVIRTNGIPATMVDVRRNGLPVFSVPMGTARITGDDVRRAEDENLMVHLLDVNLLIALAWPNHVHHSVAHTWFGAHAQTGWATCPLTECGFVWVSSNPKVIPAAVPIDVAIDALRLMTAESRHVFWPDDVAFTDARFVAHGAIQDHRQVTDAYLVGLALHHGGILATFDVALPASLPPNSRKAVAITTA